MTPKRFGLICLTIFAVTGVGWFLFTGITTLRCRYRYGGESSFAGLERWFAYKTICSMPYPDRF